MKNNTQCFLSIGFALVLASCASTTLQKQTFKSYTLGTVKTATVGEAFLIDQDGTIEDRKVWVGLLYSPDGWQRTQQFSRDFIRRELLYAGRSGSTIEISYREFRGGLAAPAFFQNLKYDLDHSNIIRFQNFTIEVLRADNQTITYKIMSDRG